MDKAGILKSLLAELEAELRRQQQANEKASAGATDSESRAETKWDTSGLEASYLARGHARQFALLSSHVQRLRNFAPASFDGLPIGIGALVECVAEGQAFHLFLLDCGGGIELAIDGTEVTVITPESPIGNALSNKRQGDRFAVPGGISGTIRRVE
ncbi:MAG TPA: hypothetical protein VK995_01830 [Oceanipulchritudo sp.]|nr:hypothetical protein [Oceanipulchritudo sp.]